MKLNTQNNMDKSNRHYTVQCSDYFFFDIEKDTQTTRSNIYIKLNPRLANYIFSEGYNLGLDEETALALSTKLPGFLPYFCN